MWFEEYLPEGTKREFPEGYPPFYKVRGGKTAPLQFYLWVLNVVANAFMKLFAQVVLFSVGLERYTKAHQGPRVVGVLLVLFAAGLQLAGLILSK